MDDIRMPVVHVYGQTLIDHARWETNSNRYEVSVSYICACAACGQYFFPEEIRRWSGRSAVCPFCGKEAVLPDSCHLPVSPDFLRILRGDPRS